MKPPDTPMDTKLVVKYFPGLSLLLRSSWMALETITTFETEIEQVSLYPPINAAGRLQITLG